jgi:hypothetical protein
LKIMNSMFLEIDLPPHIVLSTDAIESSSPVKFAEGNNGNRGINEANYTISSKESKKWVLGIYGEDRQSISKSILLRKENYESHFAVSYFGAVVYGKLACPSSIKKVRSAGCMFLSAALDKKVGVCVGYSNISIFGPSMDMYYMSHELNIERVFIRDDHILIVETESRISVGNDLEIDLSIYA